ncbi:MAG TPA: hypothetical protein VLT62_09610 [Candidatus Methylomirabilis sp.]|nr:hypothetical protein [Candidatus Methylomirabilis sp.]
MLTPSLDSEWRAAWIEGERKGGGTEGATSGIITGMAILQSVPIMVLTWPVAVGVMAGTTALGALGQHFDSGSLSRVSDEDRGALLAASANLHPDRLLREAVTKGLIHRTARPPIPILWYPNSGPDTPGTDPLVDARSQGADGLLEIATETFGLAGGEDEETFGVFLRVRAQVLDVAGGRLRYQRVLEYGPGRRLSGAPPAASYSIEFLALDQARVFRQEVREAIERIARILAEDPALPLAPR